MAKVSEGVKFMFFSIVSFSLMHLCVKGLPGIPVHQIITFRSVFSILICIYVLYTSRISPWGTNKFWLIFRGAIGALSLLCFFYSIQHLPLATAVTISNLIPLFTLVLASLFLHEKISGWQWFFFLFSFLGVVLIKGFDSRVSISDLLIAVAAAFFTACAHFTVRKLNRTEDPQVIIFYFPLVTIPLIAPYTAIHWVSPDLAEWGLLFLVGLFTHIGQVYLTKAYRYEEMSGVTNIYYLGIVLSLIYGYFIFDETFHSLTICGMLLIMGGVALNIKHRKTG